ncbi:hypothetical protein LTS10_011013 [Elasticomyces elasticus]|nr:hypothetical protein LTS10_011013 [Elasticomyces elasticus]
MSSGLSKRKRPDKRNRDALNQGAVVRHEVEAQYMNRGPPQAHGSVPRVMRDNQHPPSQQQGTRYSDERGGYHSSQQSRDDGLADYEHRGSLTTHDSMRDVPPGYGYASSNARSQPIGERDYVSREYHDRRGGSAADMSYDRYRAPPYDARNYGERRPERQSGPQSGDYDRWPDRDERQQQEFRASRLPSGRDGYHGDHRQDRYGGSWDGDYGRRRSRSPPRSEHGPASPPRRNDNAWQHARPPFRHGEYDDNRDDRYYRGSERRDFRPCSRSPPRPNNQWQRPRPPPAVGIPSLSRPPMHRSAVAQAGKPVPSVESSTQEVQRLSEKQPDQVTTSTSEDVPRQAESALVQALDDSPPAKRRRVDGDGDDDIMVTENGVTEKVVVSQTQTDKYVTAMQKAHDDLTVRRDDFAKTLLPIVQKFRQQPDLIDIPFAEDGGRVSLQPLSLEDWLKLDPHRQGPASWLSELVVWDAITLDCAHWQDGTWCCNISKDYIWLDTHKTTEQKVALLTAAIASARSDGTIGASKYPWPAADMPASTDRLVVPVPLLNHWVVASIAVKTAFITTYDSLPSAATMAALNQIMPLFATLVGLRSGVNWGELTWDVTQAVCTQQVDLTSCGVVAVDVCRRLLRRDSVAVINQPDQRQKYTLRLRQDYLSGLSSALQYGRSKIDDAVGSKPRPSMLSSLASKLQGKQPTVPAMTTPDKPKYFTISQVKLADGKSPPVHYCTDAAVADEVAKRFMHAQTLGFDIEYKPGSAVTARDAVSVIQVATADEVAVFHLAVYPPTADLLGPSLRAIIESKTIAKVGNRIKGDMTRIETWYHTKRVNVHDLMDTSKDARANGLISDQKLSTQFQMLTKQDLYKGNDVRMSDWSQRLSSQQLEYCATDAYVSLVVYEAWQRRAREQADAASNMLTDDDTQMVYQDDGQQPDDALTTQPSSTPAESPAEPKPSKEEIDAARQTVEGARWVKSCNENYMDRKDEFTALDEWKSRLNKLAGSSNPFAGPLLRLVDHFQRLAETNTASENKKYAAIYDIEKCVLPLSGAQCDIPLDMLRSGVMGCKLGHVLEILPRRFTSTRAWADDMLLDLMVELMNRELAKGGVASYIVAPRDVRWFQPQYLTNVDHVVKRLQDTIEEAKNALAVEADPETDNQHSLWPGSWAPAGINTLCVVLNLAGNHWTTLCYKVNDDRTRGQMLFYNSYQRTDGAGMPIGNYWNIASSQALLLAQLISMNPNLDWQGVQWEALEYAPCPQQTNTSDCGFFACYFAKQLALGQPVTPVIDFQVDMGDDVRWAALDLLYPFITGEKLSTAVMPVQGSGAGPQGGSGNTAPPKKDDPKKAGPKKAGPKKAGPKTTGPTKAESKSSTEKAPTKKGPAKKTTAKSGKISATADLAGEPLVTIDDDDTTGWRDNSNGWRADVRQIACNILVETPQRTWAEDELVDEVLQRVKALAESHRSNVDDEAAVIQERTRTVLQVSGCVFSAVDPELLDHDGSPSYNAYANPNRRLDTATQIALLADPVDDPVECELRHCKALTISIVRDSGATKTPKDDLAKQRIRSAEQVTAYWRMYGIDDVEVTELRSTEQILAQVCDGVAWTGYCYNESSTHALFDTMGGQESSDGERLRHCLEALNNNVGTPAETFTDITLLYGGPDGGSSNNDTWSLLRAAYPKLRFVVVMVIQSRAMWHPHFFRVDPSTGNGWATFDCALLAQMYERGDVVSEHHNRFLTACNLVQCYKLDHKRMPNRDHVDGVSVTDQNVLAVCFTAGGRQSGRKSFDLSRDHVKGPQSDTAQRCGQDRNLVFAAYAYADSHLR